MGQREVLRAANGVAQREEVDVDGAIVVDAVAAFCLAAQALLYVLRATQDSWCRQRRLEKGYGIEKRVGRLKPQVLSHKRKNTLRWSLLLPLMQPKLLGACLRANRRWRLKRLVAAYLDDEHRIAVGAEHIFALDGFFVSSHNLIVASES